MPNPTSLSLLRDALLLLREPVKAGRQPDHRHNCHALANRIEAHLAGLPAAMAPDDIVAATRRGWRADPRIRIDDRVAMRLDGDGMWVAGWILAGSQADRAGTIGPTYALALAALPLMPREVLRLHREEGLDYPTIGHRLGLGTVEVQRYLVDALIAIDAVLGPD